jgi:hypothetical protein
VESGRFRLPACFLCFGPLLTAASTARSKRSHPSGRDCKSVPFVFLCEVVMPELDDGALFIIHSPDTLPPDPPYAHEFYEAIGRFTVIWGSMEAHLEALLRIAINIEGKTEPERIFQVSLGRKIDQLKDICRDCPKLQSLEATVRSLSPTVKEWGQDRDFLIHSILVGVDDGPPPKIILRHIEHPKGTMMRAERGDFTLEHITGFMNQVKNLHRNLIAVIEAAVNLQDPQTIEKARWQVDQADPKNKTIHL